MPRPPAPSPWAWTPTAPTGRRRAIGPLCAPPLRSEPTTAKTFSASPGPHRWVSSTGKSATRNTAPGDRQQFLAARPLHLCPARQGLHLADESGGSDHQNRRRVTPGEDSYANYTSHPAYNSREGASHNGWTPVLLATLRASGVTPDFIIHHRYPESGRKTTRPCSRVHQLGVRRRKPAPDDHRLYRQPPARTLNCWHGK